jgi:hypothetical protein
MAEPQHVLGLAVVSWMIARIVVPAVVVEVVIRVLSASR